MVYVASKQSSLEVQATDVGFSTNEQNSSASLRIDPLEVHAMYANRRIRVKDICSYYNFSADTMYRILRESNIPFQYRGPNPKRTTHAKSRKICALRDTGKSYKEICDEVKVSNATVSKVLAAREQLARVDAVNRQPIVQTVIVTKHRPSFWQRLTSLFKG